MDQFAACCGYDADSGRMWRAESEVRQVLDVNKQERHIRGGLATREKYLHQH